MRGNRYILYLLAACCLYFIGDGLCWFQEKRRGAPQEEVRGVGRSSARS